MADSGLKGVLRLVVAADGRTAENWNAYKLQLENALSSQQSQKLFLDDVLLNKGKGKEAPEQGSEG